MIIYASMGTIRKTITVTSQQDSWIKARIAAGLYTNDSEYVRDLIRRDQARSAHEAQIRDELISGEQSGEPEAFDAGAFIAEMASKHDDKLT